MSVQTTRRHFLHLVVLGSAGSLLAACAPAATPPAPTAAPAAAPKPTTAPAPAATTAPAAAAKPTTAPAPAATTAPAAAKPGTAATINVAYLTKPTGFYSFRFIAQQVSNLFFDKPLVAADDATLQPRLAERWEMAPDAMSVTFHLRRGVKWSDGAPVTSRDFAFMFKTTMDTRTNALPGPTSIIKGYADFREGKIESPPGVVIVDDNTLRLDFDQPNAGFPAAISFLGFQVVPEHILGKVDPKELEKHPFWLDPTVGTGPYTFVKYETDQFIELKRNPNYWGKPPAAERMFVKTLTSSVAIAQLEKGEIHMTQTTATDAERLATLPGVKVVSKPSPGIMLMAPGVDQPKLGDKRVRQAILHAIDREGIVKEVLKGRGQVVNSHIIGPEWALNPDLNTYPYNPERARALLREANWDANTPVDINWQQGERDLDTTLQIVQGQLQAAGIKAELRPVERGPILEAITQRKFDLIAHGGGVYTADPDTTSYVLMCEFAQPKGANNPAYCNNAVDDLFRKGRSTTNQAERATAYKAASKLINEDVSHIWLFRQDAIWAYSDKLDGLKPHGDTNLAWWNAEDWTLRP